MNVRKQPVYVCIYEDGNKRSGSYAETLEWFNEAKDTDNPCRITCAHTGYTPT